MLVSSPLASLHTILQTVCANAKANASLLRKNEAATRAALIDPVLRALGWDTSNVQMVEPEKTIGGELRVDYLLHDVSGKPRLVVEAKCLDASLDKHGYVSKILGYALGFKVQTVFITDGLSWHCYSDLHKGNTEAVIINLTRDELLSASLQLIHWLDAANSGHGISLPAVPSKSEVAKEMLVLSEKLTKSVVKLPRPESLALNGFVELTEIHKLQLEPGQKPKQLRLPDGSVVSLKTWKDILEKACEFSLQHNHSIPLPYSDKAGKKTFLLNIDKPSIGASKPFDYLGKPVFIYTNYSAKDCIANALHAFKLAPKNFHRVTPAVTF